MDVNPIKPVPVVQPPRKVQRERQDREREKGHNTAEHAVDTDERDDGSKRIDTYA